MHILNLNVTAMDVFIFALVGQQSDLYHSHDSLMTKNLQLDIWCLNFHMLCFMPKGTTDKVGTQPCKSDAMP